MSTQTEKELRIDLAACYRLVDLFGMTDLIFNHISAKVPGPEEHFLINPFGMMYEEITASSLIKVDLDGTIIANANPNYSVNRTGYVIHSAIHGARPDIGCVLHTHTPAGMAVSALACGLVPVAQTMMRFSGGVAYHDFEGLAVDVGERARLVAHLGDCNALILRNHGLLTTGKTVAEAFVSMHRLEKACQTQLLATSANAELSLPPQPIIERTYQQLRMAPMPDAAGNQQAHGFHEWPALLRMLDRRDRSYRD